MYVKMYCSEELEIKDLTDPEVREMAQKIVEVLSKYERSCGENQNLSNESLATRDGGDYSGANTKGSERYKTIMARILDRYTRFKQYGELRKLIEILGKKGLFDVDASYDRQRCVLSEISDSERYIDHVLFRLDRFYNKALDNQRYIMPPED